MTKSITNSLVAAPLILSATVVARGQSAYFQAVTNLNAAGYWPMHEVEAPAPGNIETNYGTLGVLGNGYYNDWTALPGAVNTLVFDIETVPDTELGRRLYELKSLSDEQIGQIMFSKRRQETGGEFLSHEQHRVVAISVVMRSRDTLRVWSLGGRGGPEKDLIERFFDGVDKYTPDLVSWNGAGFDLPVLHYRSLLHRITAARYWETGDRSEERRVLKK